MPYWQFFANPEPGKDYFARAVRRIRPVEGELERLVRQGRSLKDVDAELEALFAKLDAYQGPDNGKSFEEIEAEMYGEHGEPI